MTSFISFDTGVSRASPSSDARALFFFFLFSFLCPVFSHPRLLRDRAQPLRVVSAGALDQPWVYKPW